MNLAAELAGKVFLLAIVHVDVAKRHIGNGEVNTSVGNIHLLESLDLHICIGVEQLEDAARDVIQLNGSNGTAFADILGHGCKDIADAGRPFQYVAALKAKALGNIPHGFDDFRGSIVCGIDGESRSLHFFVRQERAHFAVFWRIFVVEVTTQTSPTRVLAKHGHLFFGRLLSTVL